MVEKVSELVWGYYFIFVDVVLQGKPRFLNKEIAERFVVYNFDASGDCLFAFFRLLNGNILSAAEVIDSILALQQQITLFRNVFEAVGSQLLTDFNHFISVVFRVNPREGYLQTFKGSLFYCLLCSFYHIYWFFCFVCLSTFSNHV